MSKQIQWFPGHMKKALDEIQGKLKWIDLVIEVVDARCPHYSQNPTLHKILGNKPRLVIALKKDLAEEKEIHQLENENMFFACIKDKNLKERVIKKVHEVSKARVEKLKRKGLVNPKIRVMVVGLPNIGKSSLINMLSGRKAAKVENRPGVTMHQQWIKVDRNIELFDTPGVLWPKFENESQAISLVLINCIKRDILPLQDIMIWIHEYLIKNYPNAYYNKYSVSEEEMTGGFIEAMDAIAKKKGLLKKGGETDLNRVYSLLLKDIQNSNIQKLFLEK